MLWKCTVHEEAPSVHKHAEAGRAKCREENRSRQRCSAEKLFGFRHRERWWLRLPGTQQLSHPAPGFISCPRALQDTLVLEK